MATAALVGSTGLVGSNILSQLLAHPSFSSVYAYTRRELSNPTASTKLTPLSSTDSSTWPSLFPTAPTPTIFFSGLGTTRGQAGGLENQRKIDLDLNYDLAKAAKEAGCDTYVLISSASASSQSMLAYSKMKGELEDKVKDLGFKHTVFLRPGLIVGTRQDSRAPEAVMRGLATGLGKLSPMLKNSWAQDADVIARAAVNAGLQCVDGKKEEGVWVLGQKEIIRLGEEKK
ncbi:NAD dependent epimerase/dehydratase family protein-like protein [Lindgomyces ingoldianus]|uniref:NAD dependent epimerase/dehydratase family protein-like protein n=1 Tax=Lindgomyces ingoldianus TaxID=673940 RepID=A0ACB6R0E9_9PLEO|nr:NAD dependent epimerase/dehydratase family protein-like protein [Lindgomyces ingoldianus]KAF2472517.1 NAD dependent epimerase/dehydratase family protein-like protein [Lindgomyces ingoldianus]